MLIGKVEEEPSWKAKVDVLNDGRVMPYVTPIGGKMNIDINMLVKELGL